MTQLLLFDTPAKESFAPVTPLVPEVLVPEVPTRDRPTDSLQKQRNQYQPGVNPLGDLARLVLLRYDLVAQRRAKRLAKNGAGNACPTATVSR
jgi:hypothetical protein